MVVSTVSRFSYYSLRPEIRNWLQNEHAGSNEGSNAVKRYLQIIETPEPDVPRILFYDTNGNQKSTLFLDHDYLTPKLIETAF